MIIVLPFCNKDAVLAAKNLEWILELDGKTRHSCLLAWEDGTNPESITRMRDLANAAFTDVKEFSYPESSNKHWPAGANWAWQNVARYIPMVYTKDEPWLFLEADATPLKPGWVDTLIKEYKKGGKAFMGHVVKEMGHMNGVAAYPNHVSWYCTTALLVEHSAWDVALKEQTIEHTHRANHLIQHCWVMINGSPSHNGDGTLATFRDTADVRRIIEPDAVIFHRCKDGSLIDCLHAMHTANECIEEVGEVATVEAPPVYPKTEIFIVTYFKDAPWLKYCLHSIRKFANGFTGVTVACPDRDVELIEPVVREWGPEGTEIELYAEADGGRGMIHHQGIKCSADQYCKRGDFILHTDSDCIFTEPVTPGDYFVDGKPVLLKEAYERFRDKHPTILLWQQHCEHALGFKCPVETMRRHPAVHPRFIYSEARQRVEKKHGVPFMDYVLSRKPDFPQGISEFNLLGGFAHALYPSHYHWIDTAVTLAPKDKIHQSWSHGGLDRPSDTGRWPGQTPREIFQRILGI